MRRLNKTKFYSSKNYYSIYILLDKNTNQFFIGYASPVNLLNNYRKHMSGHNYKTKEWIHKIKEQEARPCIFILDNLYETQPKTYSYMVAWLKLLKENGYFPINKGTILEYAEDLLEENAIYYKNHQDIDLQKLLHCKSCVLPKYKNKVCKYYVKE